MNDSRSIDGLTGLASHDHFRSWLGDALIDEGRLGASDSLALVCFNVQNFKGYNERYGFDAGNGLLVLIADAIKDAFPDCNAARFSADQFMVAAPASMVESSVGTVRRAFRAHHKDSSIWLKAGYYITRLGDSDAGVVCDRAKMACDAIKGRRDVYIREYDNALQQEILLRHYVLDHFEEALEKHWIKIYYQPIVRVATGEVCDEEALARWVDPAEGLIPPIDFVPVLEEARLVHRLDLYMVRRVCENSAKLLADGIEPIPVSVNLSRIDFEVCDIVSEVEAILDEYGVSRNMLSIELTESVLTGNREFLKGEVDRFRADGFEVWVDDFGSGYSSLATLKEYSFDLVKIDMGFLEKFDEDTNARIMLAHIISMAKELGLKTLVEGVELSSQFAFLKSIGCGRAQGFLLGRPASLVDSEKAIMGRKYPAMEPGFKREFYEDVGRVNMIRPDPKRTSDGDYIPSDIAAAIVRRRNGRYEYLNTSDLFVKFLQEFGLGDVSYSERIINDRDNPQSKRLMQMVDSCEEAETWVRYPLEIDGKSYEVRLRRISRVPDSDVLAVLAVVD